MRSCSEQPAHSTWVWLYARTFQNQLVGKASATREKRSTSPIINSITNPRYASTATLRAAGRGLRKVSSMAGKGLRTVEGSRTVDTLHLQNSKEHTRNRSDTHIILDEHDKHRKGGWCGKATRSLVD